MKVGDYVRTKSGYIYKVKDTKDDIILDNNYSLFSIIRLQGEVKSSPNIIDLIEVGDYVNGVLINIKDNKGVYHGAYDSADEVHITKFEDIKSIVTYEQFESMKYKVGE